MVVRPRGAVVKYPTASEVEEMKARGFDPSVIAEQTELSKRGQTLESLKDAAKDAFAGVTLGSGVGLYEAQGIDDYADKKTCAAFREKDQKGDWSAISVEDLNRCSSSLCFFDAEGMRFHFPAFLIAAIDGEYGFDLAYNLTQSTLVEDQFSLLTAAQRQVVREYLRFIEQEEEHAFSREHIQRALASYWAE
jgi:hypothetical protein